MTNEELLERIEELEHDVSELKLYQLETLELMGKVGNLMADYTDRKNLKKSYQQEMEEAGA